MQGLLRQPALRPLFLTPLVITAAAAAALYLLQVQALQNVQHAPPLILARADALQLRNGSVPEGPIGNSGTV